MKAKKEKTKWVCVGGRIGGPSHLDKKTYKLVISQYGSDVLGCPYPTMIEVQL